MERRDFMKNASLAAAAVVVPAGAQAQGVPAGAQAQGAGGPAVGTWQPPETIDQGGMKFRVLGETGERVSLVGIGGYHLALPGGPTPADATRIVRAGIDAGINFCDNCWDYNGGESEVRLGNALRDGYRNRAFLMTKIDGRTAQAAMGQIETSLKRLQTDHIDLLQFHEVIRMDDPERIFAQGGAMEAVLRAKQQGKIRHIGFTGHKSPAMHRHMFEVAAQHQFHFDTVQMPVNIMDAHFDSFQQTIFPIAQQQKTAVLAMKTFGDHFILDAKVAQPIEMLHYSMSQSVAVVITGIDRMPILEQALQAVRTYQPMTQAQQQALLARSVAAAQGGKTEHYKIGHNFDGTIQNPGWLTQG
ncbi:MAG: aldo/keto reductase [Acetobacteraceae bacterium]|nr:aldo/keto reductase [Acetobacteraceae bacterium]